jgi:hypothetical protein
MEPGPKPAEKPAPSGDIYHDFPREAGELTSDYHLRRILHQQAEWRRKQQEAGIEEESWPRLWPNPPEQYM